MLNPTGITVTTDGPVVPLHAAGRFRPSRRGRSRGRPTDPLLLAIVNEIGSVTIGISRRSGRRSTFSTVIRVTGRARC